MVLWYVQQICRIGVLAQLMCLPSHDCPSGLQNGCHSSNHHHVLLGQQCSGQKGEG